MLRLYTLTWMHDSQLAQGKGRATNNEKFFVVTCLCENRSQALFCADYHYTNCFPHRDKFCFDDGEIKLSLSKNNSREIHAHYLMLSEFNQPFDLINVKSNYKRLNSIIRYL